MRQAMLWMFVMVLMLTSSARAWFAEGHHRVTMDAVRLLPVQVPEFFREGAGMMAHVSADPDLFKSDDMPQLNDHESPDHYLDWEYLGEHPLPPTRHEFYVWCQGQKLDPKAVGTLPYAIAEWTQRLTLALAEHRKWPDNPYIQQKALVYAGMLAHYAGDGGQPLHVTVHHDGRAGENFRSPRTGIHTKMDALLAKLDSTIRFGQGDAVQAMPKLWEGILLRLRTSYEMVDQVYEMEGQLPAVADPKPGNAAIALGLMTGNHATRFLAELYLTAWVDSAQVNFPRWHQRDAD